MFANKPSLKTMETTIEEYVLVQKCHSNLLFVSTIKWTRPKKNELRIMVLCFSSTTRSNRRHPNGSEPRGRSGGLLGRCAPCETSPSLAGATDSAALQQSRQRPLGSQYFYRRHFFANPFGFTAQRGVERAN